MRVVLDVLGSPEHSGGMRLHATEVVRSWAETFPDDRLTVVGPAWAVTEFADLMQVRVHLRGNDSVLLRSTGQLVTTARVARRVDADAVISLSPIVTMLSRRPTYCFQHDWRHLKVPAEFPLHQRMYRRLWLASAARARLNLCISAKALRETGDHVPSATVALVENGRDHPRRWPATASDGLPPAIVTFGHHNNKRPELVIDALARLDAELAPRLVVLGARGTYAEELRARADRLGVADRVELPGFVTQRAYQAVVARSACVVLASSDEGFGLPVAEAQWFGVPSVITDDSGMAEIFGDLPVCAAPDPASLARAIEAALTRPAAVPGVGEDQTWRATVERIRSLVSTGDRRPSAVSP